MALISVILPVYYEEELIESSYQRLLTALKPLEDGGDKYELVFVNDGSRDQSFPILKEIAQKDKKVKIVSFARNFGHQTAITAGMKYAKGDAVVTIDADMQDPPELIVDMVAKWREGWDVVYGVHKKRKGETIFKKMTAHVFYRFLAKMSTIKIPTDSGDFRLFSRAVCDEMNNLPEHNRYIRGLMVWVGYKHTPLEFDRSERAAGETKYTLKKMLKLASDGVLGFSYAPISFLWKSGIIMALFAFLAIWLMPTIVFFEQSAYLYEAGIITEERTVQMFLTKWLLLGGALGGLAIAILGIIWQLIRKLRKSKITSLGIGIVVLSLYYVIMLVYAYWGLKYGGVFTIYTTTIIGAFLTGILLIGMGIIGEYIARMMDEVRRRPLYTIEEKVNIEK